MVSVGIPHPLPPPVPPEPPDFHFCHPFYGIGLNRQECLEAASRLPIGSMPVPVAGDPHPHQFPIEITSGRYCCRVSIAWAFPDTLQNAIGETSMVPDAFRKSAAWVIEACVAQSTLGGFATISLQNMIDWIANDSTPWNLIDTGRWPLPASFFTVTVDVNGQDRYEVEYDDPAIAWELSDGVRQKGNHGRADGLEFSAEGMMRNRFPGVGISWWHSFESETGSAGEESEMVYTCDTGLGAPHPTDCSQLAYSGLAPPSDTVTVGPGVTKVLSFKTCHAAVSATHPTTLTWAQISAGLNTLIDTCVTHPWLRSRGGTAFHGATSTPRTRKRASAAVVSGLDALPPGVNITVSGQG